MIADDQRNLLTVAMICNAILLLFVLLGLLISPPIDALSAWRSNLPGVIFGLVFLLLGSIAFVRRRRWQRVNQRRQAAARGGAGVPLAVPQPAPNEEVLALPCVIRLKPHWFKYLAFFCSMTGWLVLLSLGINFLLEGVSSWPGSPSALGVLIAGVVLFLYVLARVASPQQIAVSLEGLVVIDSPLLSRTRAIGWSEARLFAICGRGKAGSPAVCYELSSPSVVVRWDRLRPQQWWALERPPTSFEEYERQMDALLSLIAARTHLLLYDVR